MIRFQISPEWQKLLFWFFLFGVLLWGITYHIDLTRKVSCLLVLLYLLYQILLALWDIIYEHF